MSLDVYLTGALEEVDCVCQDCDHQHTRMIAPTYYDANITHNLGAMAKEAGIYMHLWRPEEIGITKAAQLIEPLREGLALLRSDPKEFHKFDAPNGWGLYEHFIPFVANYLEACEAHPEANVRAWR